MGVFCGLLDLAFGLRWFRRHRNCPDGKTAGVSSSAVRVGPQPANQGNNRDGSGWGPDGLRADSPIHGRPGPASLSTVRRAATRPRRPRWSIDHVLAEGKRESDNQPPVNDDSLCEPGPPRRPRQGGTSPSSPANEAWPMQEGSSTWGGRVPAHPKSAISMPGATGRWWAKSCPALTSGVHRPRF